MLKPDRFSCSQQIQLKRDPPVADSHYMRVYLLAKPQQPTKHILRCMVHAVFSTLQLI